MSVSYIFTLVKKTLLILRIKSTLIKKREGKGRRKLKQK